MQTPESVHRAHCLAVVAAPAGTRADHPDKLMNLLDQIDVEAIEPDPDGFDARVRAVRQELRPPRRAAGSAESGPAPRQLAVHFLLLFYHDFSTICIRYFL